MRGGDINDKTSFVILCNASMKRTVQSATTYNLPYTYTYIFRWKSKYKLNYDAKNSVLADQLSNAISALSCFLNVVTSTYAS